MTKPTIEELEERNKVLVNLVRSKNPGLEVFTLGELFSEIASRTNCCILSYSSLTKNNQYADQMITHGPISHVMGLLNYSCILLEKNLNAE